MKKIFDCCLLLLISFCATTATAQQTDYSYNKEKIYIHTNHVFFKPGDALFFKLYLVNGADNKPSKTSNVVYVDVLGPAGTVVEKQTYKTEDGYCEGSYNIQDGAVGGLYKLKAYTSWMLNEKDSSFFVKEITVQKIIAPRILMKLDFPKKGYGAGDEVGADFSMRNLDGQPIRNYPVKFTVSLNGKTEETNTLNTGVDGKAVVKFFLPQSLQTTDGLLNITVDYDSYTESISRSIPITLNKIDLQFMPEGGSFIAGISTNIAFKAVNEFGKPVDASGIVTDSKGKTVASFESFHAGMGKFTFTPNAGEAYTAKITSPKNIGEVYHLPASVLQGVVMNMQKADNKIAIKLTATNDVRVKLVGQSKGVNYYAEGMLLKKGLNTVEIPESTFPAGIAQFSVYNQDNMPLAERLLFLNEHRKLHVTINTDKPKYLPREKVVMSITTTDENGLPVPSNFSVAVVDDKLWTLADDKQDNILSWLLMSSELKGKIDEPQFYFNKDEPKAAAALDLVMLTNGYRYFDFIDYVQQNGELKFTPDEEGIVSGIIINEKDEPVTANVFMMNNTTGGKVLKVKTGEDGVFYFPSLLANANYILLAQPLRKKEKLKIKVLQSGTGFNPLKNAEVKKLAVNEKFDAVVKQPAKQKAQLPEQVDLKMMMLPNTTSHLDEVVVVGYGAVKKRDITGSIVVVTTKDLQAIPVNGVEDALSGKVAGLVVMPNANPGEAGNIQIRGAATMAKGNQPLLVINGTPQEKYDLSNINVNDIESVEIIKDATAVALYGARAANGVIIIQDKALRNEKWRFNLNGQYNYAMQPVTLKMPNYTVARRFYVPKYTSTVTSERSDFRETVYWNPVVQTDRSGKATVEFYNSDATTTFRAVAEGIGYNGKLGRAETTYAAQSAMAVDAKIPPYLTIGDKALVPLVVKNNSSQTLSAKVAVELPVNMQAGAFNAEVSLSPDSSAQIFVPIQATAVTNGNIRFLITSQLGAETIVLPISAAEKGFPVIETFAGNQSAKHVFTIGKIIPGTLHSQLTLYKNVEGQLVNGIESMLREPYGCFEQTSSSTYPNIFILKYLRQAGKSNPAIEKKAMGYIEAGYKRLIGFETPENGFEWFGHAPAHEALTAYGLLEFTDMQEFLNVDKAMLRRTKDFLLQRRDGQGGFKLVSGGYDEFASVPNKIASVYIVYALSQAGYGNEIALEYHAAVKKAMASNDAYQLGMMALAASNMHNDADYQALMAQLKNNYTQYKLLAETSVVNSRDASLRVESMALYALALMRAPSPNVGTVAELISKIINEKSYYGYGSTQATVLALNAVVEYAKLAGDQAKQQEILFKVDGKDMLMDDSITQTLREGENSFTVDYVNPQGGIPYNLEVAYNTFTPPNSEKADLALTTNLSNSKPHIGETVRMDIEVKNKKSILQPMAIAKIGIPAGLSLQPWQLKELTEKKQVAYYEIFDNYLVLYWMGFAKDETKKISLDLKAEIPGSYKAKTSNVYLYYTPEYKNWNEGVEVEVTH